VNGEHYGIKIEIMEPDFDTLEEAQSAAIQQLDDEIIGRPEVSEHTFFSGAIARIHLNDTRHIRGSVHLQTLDGSAIVETSRKRAFHGKQYPPHLPYIARERA
jgi:hypothetical protein